MTLLVNTFREKLAFLAFRKTSTDTSEFEDFFGMADTLCPLLSNLAIFFEIN